jgi:glyoxylase-like metal-dependent hydrolase (beta-lactamase superfamily II)
MEIITRHLSINKKVIKVHAISTGLVSVKTKFRETNNKGILAALFFFFDKNFTEWMPIWTWVLELPDGIFIVDTGENAHVSDEGYFKSSGYFSNWLNTTQFKFTVKHEDELDRQLYRIGIQPSDIKSIVLTHLHLDHIDGLKFFPKTPVLVNSLEWNKPYGDLPTLYPKGFKPTLIHLDTGYGNFKKTRALTESGDLIMVETPGHTRGHSSVLLKTDQGYILFAGDVVYHQSQLLENKFSGANVDFKKASQTYAAIKEFAKKNPLVVLPSHDKEAGERLKNMQTLPLQLL